MTKHYCFWDSFPFSGTPVYLPIEKSEDETKSSTFCFCSVSCSLAFLLDTTMFSDTQKAQIRGYLVESLMEERDSPGDVSVLFAAPRFTLKRFGGTKTIDEFRSGTEQLSVVSFNMINVPIPVEKRTIYRGAVSISEVETSRDEPDIIDLD